MLCVLCMIHWCPGGQDEYTDEFPGRAVPSVGRYQVPSDKHNQKLVPCVFSVIHWYPGGLDEYTDEFPGRAVPSVGMYPNKPDPAGMSTLTSTLAELSPV